MKTLVTYYSETNNTEKLAHAIYDGITETNKVIAPLRKAENLKTYDIIFLGFPVQGSSVPGRAEKFIKNIPEGKMLALFATHGSLRGGQLAITAFHHAICLASKTKILGTFGCRGRVKPSIIEALLENPEHRGWALEAQSALEHPDDADFEDGRQFAASMITKARQL